MTVEEYIARCDKGEYTWEDAREVMKMLQMTSMQRCIKKIYDENEEMALGLRHIRVVTEEGRLQLTEAQSTIRGVTTCLEALVNQQTEPEEQPSQGEDNG